MIQKRATYVDNLGCMQTTNFLRDSLRKDIFVKAVQFLLVFNASVLTRCVRIFMGCLLFSQVIQICSFVPFAYKRPMPFLRPITFNGRTWHCTGENQCHAMPPTSFNGLEVVTTFFMNLIFSSNSNFCFVNLLV